MKRQGDLLFEQVQERPVAAREFPQADGVIAKGEVTGHAHVLAGGDLTRINGQMVIDAHEGAVVTHEEHDRIELEPGIWLVHQQTEYVAPGETAEVYD